MTTTTYKYPSIPVPGLPTGWTPPTYPLQWPSVLPATIDLSGIDLTQLKAPVTPVAGVPATPTTTDASVGDLQSHISGLDTAKNAVGSATSLMKDPTAAAQSALGGHIGTLSNYSSSIPELGDLHGAVSGHLSDIQGHMGDKIANLKDHLALHSAGAAIQQKIDFFSKGTVPDPSGTPDFKAAFGTITQGPALAAASVGHLDDLKSMLPDPSTIPPQTISVSDGNGGTTTQPNPAYTTWKSNNQSLFDKISSVKSSITANASNFTGMISSELSAHANVGSQLGNFAFLQKIANPSAMEASILGSCVDTSKMNTSLVQAMNHPFFQKLTPPTGDETAASKAGTQTADDGSPPLPTPNLSNPTVRSACQAELIKEHDDVLLSRAICEKIVKAMDDWMKSVNYQPIKAAAMADPNNADANAQYQALKAQIHPLYDWYNTTVVGDFKSKNSYYDFCAQKLRNCTLYGVDASNVNNYWDSTNSNGLPLPKAKAFSLN